MTDSPADRPARRPVRRIGPGDRVRLAVAWLLLGLSRLAIVLLPFPAIRRVLGETVQRPAEPTGPLRPDEVANARRLGALVALAAQRTPWRSECYPQALTTRALLVWHRIPHVVSFGVRRDGDVLAAHAWVHVAGVPVTGATRHAYTEVGTFAWAPRRRDGRLR